MDVLNHRTRPSQVVTPGAIGGTIWRLMKAGDHSRQQVLAEVGRAFSEEFRRRRLNKRPVFVGKSHVVDHYPEADLATIGESTPA